MGSQSLIAFERAAIAGLSGQADLAGRLLEAWSELPVGTVLNVRTAVSHAHLGTTEESQAEKVLERAERMGLLESTALGWRARPESFPRFGRLALALHAVAHYRAVVHQDSTRAQVVLTKPPQPSVLESKLSALGWRTSDLEETQRAFTALVRGAQRRVVVMTPFLDLKGAQWLQELLSSVTPGTERALVLRTLDDPKRPDYPVGYDHLAPWLKAEGVKVFNYALLKAGGPGRETFHAKVVLCDDSSAYIGSSNMTAASLEHSMEMGVVLEGRAALRVADVVDAVLGAAIPWL
jgi:phosphatidylserine/phosphatidylglycerophosphate/cardiolipin synthase-like enzyme